MQQKVRILAVPIDNVTFDEAVARFIEYEKSTMQHHVMTPNPEMLVEAMHNLSFRKVLQNTSMNIPDGSGLLFASYLSCHPLQHRVTGVDMMEGVIASGDGTIFLLGADEGVAERCRTILLSRYPYAKIVGTYSGSPAERDFTDIQQKISSSGATILFVAFGSPAQDFWIHTHLFELRSVKVAMGVGGAFDFIAGVQLRAPQYLRAIHLEWLWRLFHQPKRWKRIFTATVIFPYFVLREKLGVLS